MGRNHAVMRGFKDIDVRLRVSNEQLKTLRDTIEMELERTYDNAGSMGAAEDEIENLLVRGDLLDILLQMSSEVNRCLLLTGQSNSSAG